MVAVLADRLGELLRRDARDRLLAGGVDVGDEHDVGLVERARELVEEIARAGVAMRLEGDDDAPVVGALRRVERRLDLGRVVAVVVDERDAARLCRRSVKRRSTPPNVASACLVTSSGTSSSSATAIAARR